jgi:hypothetical protein
MCFLRSPNARIAWLPAARNAPLCGDVVGHEAGGDVARIVDEGAALRLSDLQATRSGNARSRRTTPCI